MVLLSLVALVILVAIPISMLVFTAIRGPMDFLPFEASTFFTIGNFTAALSQDGLLRMVRDTGLYIGGAVLIAFVIGFTLAWLVERTNLPFHNVVFIGVLVPFLIPQRAILNAWLGLVLPRTGDLNILIRRVFPIEDYGPLSPFNLPAMVIAQGLLLTPLVFLLMVATLRHMNGTMEEASRASGGSGWATVRHITMPLMFPGAFTAVVLAIWLTLDSNAVPSAFAGISRVSLLNFRISSALASFDGTSRYGLAAAYAVMTMVFLFVLFAVYAYTTRRSSRYATVTGAVTRTPRTRLGRWAVPAVLLVLLYLAAMWGVPVYNLIKGSLAAGLSGYASVLSNGRFWEAARNTGMIAMGSSSIGTIVVVLVSWTVVKSRTRLLKGGMDLLATSSLVVPALLAGVAFLLFYLSVNFLPLYGTVWGVTLALSYRLAIPYRLSNAAMRQIGADMEEASSVSGGSPMATLRRVTVPILAPTVAISWVIFFVFAVRESTLTRFLGFYEPAFNSVRGFSRDPGTGAAATVLTIVFALGTILLVRYLFLRRVRVL